MRVSCPRCNRDIAVKPRSRGTQKQLKTHAIGDHIRSGQCNNKPRKHMHAGRETKSTVNRQERW